MKKINKKLRKKLWIIFAIVGILLLTAIIIFFLVNLNLRNKYLDRNYCSWKSRLAEICYQLYQPVCGYPSERTYSNSCFACMDKKVEYYIDGECIK